MAGDVKVIVGGKVIYEIGADNKGLKDGLSASEKQIKSLGDKFGSFSKEAGLALTAAGVAITGALGLMVKKSNDFHHALSEAATIGTKDIKGLEEGVKQVARTFGTDLTKTAEGAIKIISTTGLQATDTITVLNAATKASVAGFAEVADAAKLGTDVINAFGLGVGDIETVLDAVFVAVDEGAVQFDTLAQSASLASSTFAAAKIPFQEMFAASAALSKAGIDASEGMVALNQTVLSVIQPSEEAAETAKKLGLQFNAQALEAKGLAGFMADVRAATDGNIETMSALFPNVRALKGALSLTGEQFDDFNSILKQTNEGVGATDRAFNALKANDPTFVINQLKTEMQILGDEIALTLGPAITNLVISFRDTIKSVSEWANANPILFSTLTQTVAVVGGLSLGLGALLLAVNPLISATKLLGQAWEGVGTIIGSTSKLGMLGKFGLLGAAIAGIGWAAQSMYDTIWKKYWNIIVLTVADSWRGLKDIFGSIAEGIKSTLETVSFGFIEFEKTTKESFDGAAKAITDGTRASASAMKYFDKEVEERMGHSTWTDAFRNLHAVADAEMSGFSETIKINLNNVTQDLKAFDQTLQTGYNNIIPLKEALDSLNPTIETYRYEVDQATGAVKRVVDSIETANGKIVEQKTAVGGLSQIWENMNSLSISIGQTILKVASEADAAIKPFKKLSGEISSLFSISNNPALIAMANALRVVSTGAETLSNTAKEKTSPVLQAMLEKIWKTNVAMEKAAQDSRAYGDELGYVADRAREVGAVLSGVAGFSNPNDAFGGGTLGGTMGEGLFNESGGTSLAARLSGVGLPSASEFLSLAEISEQTGRSLNDLRTQFAEYVEWTITQWQHGKDVFVLTIDEYYNSAVSGFNGIRTAVQNEVNLLIDGVITKFQSGSEQLRAMMRELVAPLIELENRISNLGSNPALQTINLESRAGGGLTQHSIVKVGERGPELAALPVGTRIMSNADMMRAVKGYAGGGIVDDLYKYHRADVRAEWRDRHLAQGPSSDIRPSLYSEIRDAASAVFNPRRIFQTASQAISSLGQASFENWSRTIAAKTMRRGGLNDPARILQDAQDEHFRNIYLARNEMLRAAGISNYDPSLRGMGWTVREGGRGPGGSGANAIREAQADLVRRIPNVVGSITSEALSRMASSVSGGGGSGRGNVTINVSIDNVNANKPDDVNIFLNAMTSQLKRSLSNAGLDLNTAVLA